MSRPNFTALRWSLLAGVLAAVPAFAQSQPNDGKVYAVLVGIGDPRGVGQKELKYARQDAEFLRAHLRAQFGDSDGRLRILTAPSAPNSPAPTRETIMAQLRYVLNKEAGPDDTVYIFIAANGRAPLEADEVYILPEEAPFEKDLKQYAISGSELRALLYPALARNIVLFIDVCRNSQQGPLNNINSRLNKAVPVKPGILGLTASDGNNWSLDDPILQHGVFAFFLVSALEGLNESGVDARAADKNQDGNVTFAELQDYLGKAVPAFTNAKDRKSRLAQKPTPIGTGGPADLRMSTIKPGKDFRSVVEFVYPHGALFASVRMPGTPGLVQDSPQRTAPPTERALIQPLDRALDAGNLLGIGGATEQLEALRAVLSIPSWEAERDRVVSALLDIGQRTIASSGTGNRFTADEQWVNSERDPAEYDRAVVALTTALKLMPVDSAQRRLTEARIHFARGQSLFLSRNPAGAEQEFLECQRLAPELAEAHNALGVIYLEKSDFAAAESSFRQALKLAPRWAYPRQNLAVSYIESGDYEAAEREYRDAIRHTDFYPYLDYNLGVLLQRLGRLPEARRWYESAIGKFGTQQKEFQGQVAAWLAAGNAGEAARVEARMKPVTRNLAEAENGLGTLVQQEDRNRARTLYLQALQIYPDLLPARHNLALLERAEGNRPQAILLLRENLAQDPRFEPSKQALAETLLSERQFPEAERIFRELLRETPENMGSAAGLASALIGQGRAAEAETVLRRSLQPGAPEISLVLGQAIEDQGRGAEACREYANANRFLNDVPEDGAAREIRGRIVAKLRWCKSRQLVK